MLLRDFGEDSSTGTSVVMREIRELLDSEDGDARCAGLDFFYAIRKMKAKQQVLAKLVHSDVYKNEFPTGVTLWERSTHQHSLYLSLKIASTPQSRLSVLRNLIACSWRIEQPKRISEAAKRHRAM